MQFEDISGSPRLPAVGHSPHAQEPAYAEAQASPTSVASVPARTSAKPRLEPGRRPSGCQNPNKRSASDQLRCLERVGNLSRLFAPYFDRDFPNLF